MIVFLTLRVLWKFFFFNSDRNGKNESAATKKRAHSDDEDGQDSKRKRNVSAQSHESDAGGHANLGGDEDTQ